MSFVHGLDRVYELETRPFANALEEFCPAQAVRARSCSTSVALAACADPGRPWKISTRYLKCELRFCSICASSCSRKTTARLINAYERLSKREDAVAVHLTLLGDVTHPRFARAAAEKLRNQLNAFRDSLPGQGLPFLGACWGIEFASVDGQCVRTHAHFVLLLRRSNDQDLDRSNSELIRDLWEGISGRSGDSDVNLAFKYSASEITQSLRYTVKGAKRRTKSPGLLTAAQRAVLQIVLRGIRLTQPNGELRVRRERASPPSLG